MARFLNCSDSDDELVQCLRSVSAEDLLKANALIYETEAAITFPVVGTEYLPFSPQEAFKMKSFYRGIDILIGM